jgi:hypothetical protein
MTDAPIPRLSPEDSNPASDLKTDVIKDVEREHTITGDFVGPRSDEMLDDDGPEDSGNAEQ